MRRRQQRLDMVSAVDRIWRSLKGVGVEVTEIAKFDCQTSFNRDGYL